jgi:hypothetical protein
MHSRFQRQNTSNLTCFAFSFLPSDELKDTQTKGNNIQYEI